MSNHFDPIPNDFNAVLAHASSDTNVYVHIDNAYLHFLVRTKYEQGYSILSQYYYPRLFLSLSVMRKFESSENPLKVLSSVPASLPYLKAYKVRVLGKGRFPEVRMHFGKTKAVFDGRPEELIKAMHADAEWYFHFITSGEETPYLNAYWEQYHEAHNLPVYERLVECAQGLGVLAALEYEARYPIVANAVVVPETRWVDLVSCVIKSNEALSTPLMESWRINLNRCISQNQCDCGGQYCFFDLVKPVQQQYFAASLPLDSSIELYWGELKPYARGVLYFLFHAFGLSPLVSIALLERPEDEAYLRELLASSYQPDDPLSKEIGRILSMVATLIRFQSQ